jgi:hypothetical protein
MATEKTVGSGKKQRVFAGGVNCMGQKTLLDRNGIFWWILYSDLGRIRH